MQYPLLSELEPHSIGTTHNLAVCYSELGQSDKASAHLKDVLSLNPDFTISEFATGLPYRDEQVLQELFKG